MDREDDVPESPAPVSPALRRRGGLSLRWALGLVALVALAFGAWEYRARSIRAGLQMIRDHRGMYYYDFESGDAVAFDRKPRSWAPRWLRDLAGIETLHDVTYVRIVDPKFDDDDLRRLMGCFPKIRALGVEGTSITDRGLSALRGSKHLLSLFLKSNGITDAGIDLVGVETIPQLSFLDVRGTRVSSAKLKAVDSFLKAREAAARKANSGRRIYAHSALGGRWGKPFENEVTREVYESDLGNQVPTPK